MLSIHHFECYDILCTRRNRVSKRTNGRKKGKIFCGFFVCFSLPIITESPKVSDWSIYGKSNVNFFGQCKLRSQTKHIGRERERKKSPILKESPTSIVFGDVRVKIAINFLSFFVFGLANNPKSIDPKKKQLRSKF